MMHGATDPRADDLIDFYLDNLLEDECRQEIKARIQQEALLREAIERQGQVDASLRRLFGIPASVSWPVTAERSAARSRFARRRFSRPMLAVAAIVIGAVALWRLWTFAGPHPTNPYNTMMWRSMETVYHDVAQTGFRTKRAARTNGQLAQLFERRFDQPLSYRTPTVSVRPMGLGFCNTITKNTVCLIARIPLHDGEAHASSDKTNTVGVLVFVDVASADAARALPSGTHLHVFKRIIGQLAMYEVSPLNQSRALDLLYIPDGIEQ